MKKIENKKNLNMNYEDIKRLFNKFNIHTLESIDVLLSCVSGYNLDETNSAYLNVYKNKYEKIKEEFNGINEYDDICKINDFNLSQIKNNIVILSEKELIYLKMLIDDALNNIADKDTLRSKIIPILKDCRYNINIQQLMNEQFCLNSQELEDFFNKYDIISLDSISIILDNVKEPYLENILEIMNKVYNEKKNNKYDDYNQKNKPSLLNILKKNKLLSEKELIFLYQLVSDASDFLSNIIENEYSYQQEMEDFTINDYPITEIFNIKKSLEMEIENRKSHRKKLVLK